MTTHITLPPRESDDTEHAAETSPRLRRFSDQQGIALQTVIITVVMIAIAGAIAAVLFSSAQDATDELENSTISVNAYAASTQGQCTRSNGDWQATAPSDIEFGKIQAAGRTKHTDGTDIANADLAATKKGDGWCKPKSP